MDYRCWWDGEPRFSTVSIRSLFRMGDSRMKRLIASGDIQVKPIFGTITYTTQDARALQEDLPLDDQYPQTEAQQVEPFDGEKDGKTVIIKVPANTPSWEYGGFEWIVQADIRDTSKRTYYAKHLARIKILGTYYVALGAVQAGTKYPVVVVRE